MEQLADEGCATAIGVSNFSERQLGRLCGSARIKPAVNQIELHPLLSQRRLVGACARKVGVQDRLLLEEWVTPTHAAWPPLTCQSGTHRNHLALLTTAQQRDAP